MFVRPVDAIAAHGSPALEKIGIKTMKWEYLTVEETLEARDLNELGMNGWELVAVVSPAHFVFRYFFKREVQS